MTRFIAWLSTPRIVLALRIVSRPSSSSSKRTRVQPHLDEPAHLATGLELLDLGTYHYEHQHPPLARVAIALALTWTATIGPSECSTADRFLGADDPGFDDGRRILYQVGPYERVLTLARIGILPFLLIALLATYGWARNLLGEWPAVLAVFLLVTVPPFLGNTGIATLDIPVAGMGIARICRCTSCARTISWQISTRHALAT